MGKKQDNDLGRSEVQDTFDKWNAQGYRGVKVDPTPNEAYTVAGVTSGQPTPETDADLAAEARKRADLTDEDRDAGFADKD